ncbi:MULTISPECIES: efflux RND transporter periplasmic adaptor subunit [unclassified Marinimicrobium]|uniref:efflux RND transporter periplasmic adaptor subunit n=1 Tax=unclassified Marinimicrobium TaxID=2632100 RepID=UPI000C383517|nr:MULTISPECIES: HlyD family efflux transporter periplasmic adaptor subunit [unclassified Marinimicrobium]MAN50343.1 acetyl-CoA carboxylase biotin carboxyl carrier protein subunit [Marinimicrobium sp.]
MRHRYYVILSVLMVILTSNAAFTQDFIEPRGRDEAHERNRTEHEGEEVVRISSETAQKAGLSTSQAGPATLDRILRVYGKIVVPPGQETHMRARFPGQVYQVHAQIGDQVETGDLLAEIESNDSLRTYQLRSPINGVVVDRQTAVGELTQDRALFSIARLNPLWVELHVFPAQRSAVSKGQTVLLSSDSVKGTVTLSHVLPGSERRPYLIARGTLDNRDGQWTPGLLVMGEIVVESFQASVAVDNRALQTVEGKTVVFTNKDDVFKAQLVELGRSDDRYTEILSGLEAGERYVVGNSFLVKADLLKSSVEDHD